MGNFYPVFRRVGDGGRFPIYDEPEDESEAWIHVCPICEAAQGSWRSASDLTDYSHDDPGGSRFCLYEFPHVAFRCGGVLREIRPGVWTGQCGKQMVQRTLAFAEEP
jgi:hypothetical protein